jgi:signal transduction histidine kinase
LRTARIARSADDRPPLAVYLQHVLSRLARLRSLVPDPVKADRILAIVLTVAGELEIWAGNEVHEHRLWGAIAFPLMTLPLAFRRRYPLAVGAGVAVLAALDHATGRDPQLVSVLIAYACALYTLAVWTPPRRFAIGLALVIAADLLPSAGSLKDAVPFTVTTVVAMLLTRRIVGDKERRARLAERERDVAAREAVVEERARIARELHDVIAHNVSMMVVQAGAERRALESTGGAGTHDVLETIEHIGRDALTEMRRLVGMLRSDAADPLAPQPGLADLPTLVGQVSEAGLPVALSIEGEPRELPVGIELSAYRIVQEALTNALKHAGDAHASVRVGYGPESLELEIVDDGAGDGTAASSGGHGLVGMQERVALYGGRLDAGRRPSGGFAVRVLLPIR